MDIRTLSDILARLQSGAPKAALLRFKSQGTWRDISTGEFATSVRALARGLESLGVRRGDRVAILSENRPEWTVFDHAALNLGAVVVPIYPTLLTDQVRFILDNSQACLLVASTGAQVAKVQPVLGSLPNLKRLVVLDPAATGVPPAGGLPAGGLTAGAGLTAAATAWSDVLRDGAALDRADPGRFDAARGAIEPGDLASILYTSGTTGEPKGVMLTHANFASNIGATLSVIHFTSQDVALSLLPLTHVFERMVEFTYLAAGATIAYAESIEAAGQNIPEVRPTVVAGVPRLYEKIHARVMATVRASSAVRRQIFGLALKVGRARSRALLAGRRPPLAARLLHPITDRLVFAPLRGRLGGRIRFFISGSAPLALEINEFFHAAGLRILEGYGLTETSPVIAVNTLDRARLGTVGPIVPGVEVRIAPDGEILVRGPNIMKGYFRNDEATREVMQDGWFATGDIGLLDEDGFLKITDRKKEVLKTSGGKMVAPQPIENLLKTDPFISNAVLIGDRRRFISALIVPNPELLESYARRKQIDLTRVEDLIRHPQVLDLFRRRVEEKMAGLPSYETVKKFRLLPKDLSQDAGELTPTLKVKRRVIEQKFAGLIESMYAE